MKAMLPGDRFNKFQALKKKTPRKVQVDELSSKINRQTAEIAQLSAKKKLAVKGLI